MSYAATASGCGQSLEILALLLRQPGEVVTREQIRERLRPNRTKIEFEPGVNSAVLPLRGIQRAGQNAARILAPPARY